jgi:lysophospholipase L1-like esterase
MRIGRGRTISALLVLIGLVTLAAPGHAGSGKGGGPVWYLALGDSLSVGVQPVGPGDANVETPFGYADQLFAALKAENPKLELRKLGCAVTETTKTMLRGDGECDYPGHRSQLAAAVDFLRKHRGSVALVTIDIAANDIDPCVVLGVIDEQCFRKGFIQVATHLPPILAALRVAAGPNVPIVGMNYYNPVLPVWFQDPSLAEAAAEKLEALNGLLGATYRLFRMPVADVAAAFNSGAFLPLVDIGPPFGEVPLNVATVCGLTYACTLQNIHANPTGYAVITGAFLEVLP